MQEQNPQLKYYKKLSGTWKSGDSSCTVLLDLYAHLEITYGSFKLDSSYSVMETGLLYEATSKSMPGLMSLGMGMTYKRHPGEELKIQMGNATLSDDAGNTYNVNCLWYGEEKLNLELASPSTGQIMTMVLTREEANAAPDSGYVCECGYKGSFGKFCPNCGRAVEVEYTCQCGYKSKGVKFCPNCGQPTGQQAEPVPAPAEPAALAVPEEKEEKLGWKCPKCGAGNQDGKCTVCGEEINPFPIFSISTYMSTNPPIHTFTNVYEYSDTQLLLDINGKRRLIPADVKEPAMEIIRKYRLDDPDFTDPAAMGIMGGSVTIGFKNGDNYMQASMQRQGFAVNNAQSELMGLFGSRA